MRELARLIGREIARRLAKQGNAGRFIFLAMMAPVSFLIVVVVIALFAVFAVVASQGAGGCGTSVPVGTPALANAKTAGQMVRYFESQGISANGSAGIVGNLEQETGLNPLDTDGNGGGGLAEWNSGWYQTMAAYATSRGLSPSSDAGQLTYIVYDLRTSYATLLRALNSAPSPQVAAEEFETGYEICSGVKGYMDVIPGSLCDDLKRKAYAVEALKAAGGGAAVPVSDPTGGTCVTVGGGGGDPIPGFSPSRDDMGVDACAKPGMPIKAPAASTLVFVLRDWFDGQPLLLFRFTPSLSGTFMGDQYWYVGEQIVPVTERDGTQFGAGQTVATFAASGTCIEIGWGSPTSDQRTLAGAIGRGADANPSLGELTPEAESFKRYFHIPWLGTSP